MEQLRLWATDADDSSFATTVAVGMAIVLCMIFSRSTPRKVTEKAQGPLTMSKKTGNQGVHKLVIVVNGSLIASKEEQKGQISKGKLVIQCCHVTHACCQKCDVLTSKMWAKGGAEKTIVRTTPGPAWLKTFRRSHNIVCRGEATADEHLGYLKAVESEAKNAQHITYVVSDSGLQDSSVSGFISVLGIGPGMVTAIDKVVGQSGKYPCQPVT